VLALKAKILPEGCVAFGGLRYWADCAKCGPGQLPQTYGARFPTRSVDARSIITRGYVASGACSKCGDEVALRTTKASCSHADKPREECGGACLGGKRTCSCRCGGKCHGLGICVCGGGAA
jgi:hypothetical protein